VPLAAAEVCLLLTVSLAVRAARGRRPSQVSWAVALGLFTVGAGALWYGSAFGWSAPTFRVYYVAGALFGVPWLALGQLQLLLARQTGAVLAVLLFLASAAGAAVVGETELRGTVAGPALPDGRVLLPALPRVLVAVSNAAGVLVLVAGLVVGVHRQWRAGAAGRSRATGLLLVLLGALAAGAGGALTFLGRASANAVGILVGLSLVYAGTAQAGRRVGRHRGAS